LLVGVLPLPLSIIVFANEIKGNLKVWYIVGQSGCRTQHREYRERIYILSRLIFKTAIHAFIYYCVKTNWLKQLRNCLSTSQTNFETFF
jgi:hypothetical protein